MATIARRLRLAISITVELHIKVVAVEIAVEQGAINKLPSPALATIKQCAVNRRQCVHPSIDIAHGNHRHHWRIIRITY